MTEYKHHNTDIDYYYQIKTTDGRYTKDRHRHDKGKTNSDLKELVPEPETTKENKTTEFIHPDSGIVFEVGQDWICMDGSIVKIIRFAPEAIHPIITTGEIYTKNGQFLFFEKSDSDLKILVQEPETTKEDKTPEYKHPNGIFFEVGQVWKNDDGGKFEIVEINKGITYPIKARKISQDGVSFPDRPWFIFTKNGAFIDDYKKKNCIDLKRLVINSGETVKNNEAQS